MQLLKTSLVFYVLFFLTIQVYAQGFRKASWGISIEEVKKIETSLLIKNDSNKVFSSITYSDLVGNWTSPAKTDTELSRFCHHLKLSRTLVS